MTITRKNTHERQTLEGKHSPWCTKAEIIDRGVGLWTSVAADRRRLTVVFQREVDVIELLEVRAAAGVWADAARFRLVGCVVFAICRNWSIYETALAIRSPHHTLHVTDL